ncbi:MAG: bifunctional homocysteine S-methyltransferase/methylenetetrahydrofolate reductase, partial [Oscillospiraceae bacterium]|nr:bifunctional homocysteine S-methyltransferase/methylenetetrahydrofolate reductase [Oscillospiraceae bacterium]
MTDIRACLRERGPLLFDGAMGTCFAALPGRAHQRCELACLTAPEEIAAIHRAYLEAGCRAIKTNTFTAGLELAQGQGEIPARIIQAACRIARDCAAPYDACVFADIGPAPEGAKLSRGEVYCREADLFLAQGITCFLLETLPSDDGAAQLAAHLKRQCPQAFLIVSFAVAFDGVTREGIDGRELFRRAAALPEVDAVGFNCVSGPSHLLDYVRGLDLSLLGDKALSVMPNAGYPTVLGRRTAYQGAPDYFGGRLAELVRAGAAI